MMRKIRINEAKLRRIVKESVKSIIDENNAYGGNMGIDDILTLLGGCDEETRYDSYDKLNMILYSLQRMGVVDGFNEDKLDEEFNAPAY